MSEMGFFMVGLVAGFLCGFIVSAPVYPPIRCDSVKRQLPRGGSPTGRIVPPQGGSGTAPPQKPVTLSHEFGRAVHMLHSLDGDGAKLPPVDVSSC